MSAGAIPEGANVVEAGCEVHCRQVRGVAQVGRGRSSGWRGGCGPGSMGADQGRRGRDPGGVWGAI